ncbi:MAG: hypothetical protein IPM29_24640 [Planctomycetes bacterium]|nr:hypothetical protein [Planctomycetota bacterium]
MTPRKSGLLAVLSLALLALPSCVLAVGNSASGVGGFPTTTLPLLQQKIEAAERIVALREQAVAHARELREAGRTPDDMAAEIHLEEARIQLLQFRAELLAVQDRGRDEDDDD